MVYCTDSVLSILFFFREDDRVILQACQKMGAKPETFEHIASGLKNKTADEVRLNGIVSILARTC